MRALLATSVLAIWLLGVVGGVLARTGSDWWLLLVAPLALGFLVVAWIVLYEFARDQFPEKRKPYTGGCRDCYEVRYHEKCEP